tara:strand:- start:211 stop:633 length:423 start_codon:yes stop_codon:yes gene_type:complete
MAIRWCGADAVEIVAIDHRDRSEVAKATFGNDLIVLEEGGFVGPNAASSLSLERVRERFEMASHYEGVPFVGVSPDQWRMALRMPARPRRLAVDAARQLCDLLGRPGTRPRVALANRCTNDDKRAALLIGWASVRAWGWA